LGALEDCPPEVGIPLLSRFGRLVKVIGEKRGVKLDSVFNADRVLRIPTSFNYKDEYKDEYGESPQVVATLGRGGPMDPATLAERLDEWGIFEEDGDDSIGLGEVVVAESDWRFAPESCGYSADVLRKWKTETVTERHPRYLCWLVRLECMRRSGCITRHDYQVAQRRLETRFHTLLSTRVPARPAKRYEVSALRREAIDRAERKTAEQLDAELGDVSGHGHLFGHRVAEPLKDNRMSTTQQPDIALQATTPAPVATDAPQGDSAPAGDTQSEGVAGEFEADVIARLEALRINEEAKRRLHEEQNPTPELPPVMNLRERLAQPRTQTKYLVQDLSPRGSRTIINAQFKAGKTTIAGNLIRGLVDGDDFLGQFAIHDGPHRVVLIDDELSENQLLDWLDEQGIKNQDAVADVIPLRGRVSAFNILDDRVRAMWAERLRILKTDVLILDCLRPVLDALGLDENREAGRFLVPFDALLYEAGISEAFLIHHMGHANERSRGDSRLQDWPDAIWRLVRENEQPDSARFFSAYGRDVDVPEGRLEYNEATRRLSLTGGSRKQQKAADNEAEARDALVQLMADHYLGQLTDEQGKPLELTMTTNTVKAQLHERHAVANRRADTALKQCGPRAKGGSGVPSKQARPQSRTRLERRKPLRSLRKAGHGPKCLVSHELCPSNSGECMTVKSCALTHQGADLQQHSGECK
jgi:hypothetical protein